MPAEHKGIERFETSRMTREELAHLLKAILVQTPALSPEAEEELARYRRLSNALRSSLPKIVD